MADNAAVVRTRLTAVRAGPQVLRLWRIDPGVVFERFVLTHGAPAAATSDRARAPAADRCG